MSRILYTYVCVHLSVFILCVLISVYVASYVCDLVCVSDVLMCRAGLVLRVTGSLGSFR